MQVHVCAGSRECSLFVRACGLTSMQPFVVVVEVGGGGGGSAVVSGGLLGTLYGP